MNNDRGFRGRPNRSGGFNRGGNRGRRGGNRGQSHGSAPWRGHSNFRGSQQAYGNFGGYRGGFGDWHSNNQWGQNFGTWNPNQAAPQFGAWNSNQSALYFGDWQFNQRDQQWKKIKREIPTKRLSENEIGVTEYISDHPGFNGVIKSRYSDFQVAEINEQGQIAVLTDLSPPSLPVDKAVAEDEDLLLNKYNVEILPMETWDRISKLAVSRDSDEKVEIDVTGMSKEQRTKIHDAVKKAFGKVSSIISSTVSDGDKKLVRLMKYKKGVRVDNRVKWEWPGEYVYFIVYKENCDTMDAAVRIAERLRLNIKPSMLGYAGTKDRRAKTTQWFSLRKVDPRRIAAASRDLRDLALGNYSFSKENLRLGMLKGNRFRIVLRNVTESDEVVEFACQQLKERGFLNYYGLQRFGSRIMTPTYEIGLQLLLGKFKEAIDLIIERRGEDDVGPSAWGPEMRVSRALAEKPNDLMGALNKLPRNTRLLYLHSYQSLVWNRCTSERVRRFGLVPAVGDFVPLSEVTREEDVGAADSDAEDDTEDTETDNVDKEQDGADENKMADDNETSNLSNVETAAITAVNDDKPKVLVKTLTQEDIDSGKYSIFDVVLPLPGNAIEYPPNMKDFYEELLTKDGLTLEMKNKRKSYRLCGAYRHVCVRPVQAEWRCGRYSDPHADLQLSDLDQLHGNTITALIPDGKYKALFLTMTLPASCYATMALRELLKVDTSCDNQALQNNYYKKAGNNGNQTKTNDEVKKSEKEKLESEKKSESEKEKSESEKEKSETEKEELESEKEKLEMEKEELESGNISLGDVDGMESENPKLGSEKRKLESDSNVEVKKLKQDNI